MHNVQRRSPAKKCDYVLYSPPQPPGAHDGNIPKGPTDTDGCHKALAVPSDSGAHQEMAAEMPSSGSKPSFLQHAEAGFPESVRQRIQAVLRTGYVDGQDAGKPAMRARMLGFPHTNPHQPYRAAPARRPPTRGGAAPAL